VPAEGIYRTLERWDMMCEYENGVKMHLMDHQTAKPLITKYCPNWRDGDGVVFHGTEGWIGNCWGAFYASDNKRWKRERKPEEERLTDGREHHRNWIDCVKSREQTLCHVEMAIRCDTICHMTRAAALTGRAIKWDPKKEEIIGDAEASKLLSLTHREKWKVW